MGWEGIPLFYPRLLLVFDAFEGSNLCLAVLWTCKGKESLGDSLCVIVPLARTPRSIYLMDATPQSHHLMPGPVLSNYGVYLPVYSTQQPNIHSLVHFTYENVARLEWVPHAAGAPRTQWPDWFVSP